MQLITKDLFEASYLLTEGVPLKRILGDERTVLFLFEGDETNLLSLKTRFDGGHAQTNVTTLKKNMTYLKDVMFSLIREKSARGA